jgi:hypothetical protein
MGSVQEKFTFKLQERLNKLEDLFENNLTSIHPDTESYKNLLCSDIGCVAAAAFIKIITPEESTIDKIITIIRNFKCVNTFTYHSGKLSNYSQNIPEDASYEYEEVSDQDQEKAFIVQVLVCFKHSIVASRIGIELVCKCSEESIKVELQPIYDFHDKFTNINKDTGLLKYYYYNIVALQNNKHPDIILLGTSPYSEIIKKLEIRNIHSYILAHKVK